MILATGGNGQIYNPTTNALICTGDGIAMAYRIGAPLMDMEMIQYHPTTLAGHGLLITEGARGEGAHLYNAQGERFMEKYAPNKMELASRDVVSRAEQTEINEGRGFPDGTVALDITVVPRKRIHEALREIVNVGRDFAGVDITARADPHQARQPLRHGRRQDRRERPDPDPRPLRRRRVRLRVGARRQPPRRELAARHAGLRPPLRRARRARACKAHCTCPPSGVARADEERAIQAIVSRDRSGRRVSEIKAELGETMDKYVAVFRDEDGLNTALEIVRRLKEEAKTRGDRRQGHGLQPGRARRARARVHARQRRGDRAVGASSARRAAAPSSAPTSRSATTRSGSSTSTSRRTASEPEISYSEVTITQWQPEERKY